MLYANYISIKIRICKKVKKIKYVYVVSVYVYIYIYHPVIFLKPELLS